jgi:hypothetical protein
MVDLCPKLPRLFGPIDYQYDGARIKGRRLVDESSDGLLWYCLTQDHQVIEVRCKCIFSISRRYCHHIPLIPEQINTSLRECSVISYQQN